MFSIIIVNYDNTFDTKECLFSLQDQIFLDFEIIIVDNNSHDKYRKELENFLKDNHLKESILKKIKYIPSDKNLGFTGGNNLGIKQSKGDIIVLLNSDTYHEPSFLESMNSFFKQHKSIHIAQPKICFYPQKDLIWGVGGFINKYSFKLFGPVDCMKKDNDQYKKPFRIDYAIGCALFVRKKVLKKIGLLDNIYFMYGEESDLCYRAYKLGYNIYCNPEAKIYHNTTLKGTTSFQIFHFRNRNIWCLKNFPLPLVIWQFFLQFIELIGFSIDFNKWRLDYRFIFKSVKGIFKGLKIGIRVRLHRKLSLSL